LGEGPPLNRRIYTEAQLEAINQADVAFRSVTSHRKELSDFRSLKTINDWVTSVIRKSDPTQKGILLEGQIDLSFDAKSAGALPQDVFDLLKNTYFSHSFKPMKISYKVVLSKEGIPQLKIRHLDGRSIVKFKKSNDSYEPTAVSVHFSNEHVQFSQVVEFSEMPFEQALANFKSMINRIQRIEEEAEIKRKENIRAAKLASDGEYLEISTSAFPMPDGTTIGGNSPLNRQVVFKVNDGIPATDESLVFKMADEPRPTTFYINKRELSVSYMQDGFITFHQFPGVLGSYKKIVVKSESGESLPMLELKLHLPSEFLPKK
jgi:hypothetical protein